MSETVTRVKSEARSKLLRDRWKDPAYAKRMRDVLAAGRAGRLSKKTAAVAEVPQRPAPVSKKPGTRPSKKPAAPVAPSSTGVVARYGPRRRLRKR